MNTCKDAYNLKMNIYFFCKNTSEIENDILVQSKFQPSNLQRRLMAQWSNPVFHYLKYMYTAMNNNKLIKKWTKKHKQIWIWNIIIQYITKCHIYVFIQSAMITFFENIIKYKTMSFYIYFTVNNWTLEQLVFNWKITQPWLWSQKR